MDTAFVSARVRVCLKREAKFPVVANSRPNHRIPGRADYFLGSFMFDDREVLEPGDCAQAVGRFIVLESDLPAFKPGFLWEVHGGPNNLLGTAEYLEPFTEQSGEGRHAAV
jgi:hypothetical protein